MVTEGKSNQEIADALGRQLNTVKSELHSVFKKAGNSEPCAAHRAAALTREILVAPARVTMRQLNPGSLPRCGPHGR